MPPSLPAYHRDPRATSLAAEVLDRGEDGALAWVTTADTPLYPGGGGQPADEGTVGGSRVTAVSRTATGWRHEVAGPLPPVESDSGVVAICVDWQRRFDHMQQHTAQHLLSALAQDRWGWPTTAFHLGRERSDVELATPSLSDAELAALEDALAQLVREARPVTSRTVSVPEYLALGTRSRGLPDGHEGDVRLVEIEGVDVTACGGTHLASTAEIETIKLLGTEPMRGGTRLHWVAGGRVRARLGAHEARGEALRRLLGVPDEALTEQTGARLEQLRQAERRLAWLESRLAEEAAGRIALDPAALSSAHFEGMDAAFLRAVAQQLQEPLGPRVALLTAEREGASAFVLIAGATAPLDVRATGQRVAERLEGRGGGAGQLFQGRAGSLAGRGEALAEVARALEDAGAGGAAAGEPANA